MICSKNTSSEVILFKTNKIEKIFFFKVEKIFANKWKIKRNINKTDGMLNWRVEKVDLVNEK